MTLTAFIDQNKDEIANEWIEFASENIRLTEKMNRTEIKDHIKQILERIVRDMNSSQTDAEQKTESEGNKELASSEEQAANDHGEQRLDFGFDFMQLSSEFRALRASVLRLWAKKSRKENWKTDFHDMIRFNEAVDEVWMISLKRFQEKLDESKNLFLGILGHDLRNPISTIKGAHSILKLSSNLTEKDTRTLNYAATSVERMIELINNLLELTEIRLGSRMNIDTSTLDLSDLLQEIIQQQQLAFPENIFETTIETSVKGNWDKLRLSQMLTNLITNAVKHGKPEGTVTVNLSEDEGNAYFSIHNEGPHIAEDILDKVFDGRFSSKNGATVKEKSYGLGLFIVKEIVEGHSGEIKVSSSEAHGTSFKVVLPKNPLQI